MDGNRDFGLVHWSFIVVFIYVYLVIIVDCIIARILLLPERSPTTFLLILPVSILEPLELVLLVDLDIDFLQVLNQSLLFLFGLLCALDHALDGLGL